MYVFIAFKETAKRVCGAVQLSTISIRPVPTSSKGHQNLRPRHVVRDLILPHWYRRHLSSLTTSRQYMSCLAAEIVVDRPDMPVAILEHNLICMRHRRTEGQQSNS